MPKRGPEFSTSAMYVLYIGHVQIVHRRCTEFRLLNKLVFQASLPKEKIGRTPWLFISMRINNLFVFILPQSSRQTAAGSKRLSEIKVQCLYRNSKHCHRDRAEARSRPRASKEEPRWSYLPAQKSCRPPRRPRQEAPVSGRSPHY